MQVIFRGRLVEASELKTPGGDDVIGYQIDGEGVVMPQQVQIPGGEPATVALPTTQLKAKRGKDPSINP